MKQQLLAFLNLLQTEFNYSANTTAAYRNDLNQFLVFLTDGRHPDMSRWPDVSAEVVRSYVDYMKEKSYASSSVARKVAAVKSFFNYLYGQQIISENPTIGIDSPKVKKRLPKTLASEDVERLLKAPADTDKKTPKTPKHLRDTALLTVLYATGMRVTEVVSLREEDVDLKNNLLLCPGKDNIQRRLPVDEMTKAALAEYLEMGRPYLLKDKKVDAIFLNHRGQQLTRQGLWLIIKAYAKEAELSAEVTPHTLRHSFAAHKLNSGTELQEVQKLLGHANISTTQIYTQLSNEDKEG